MSTVMLDIFWGSLGMETKENSGTFEKKLCRLDPKRCTLDCFPENRKQPDTSVQPDHTFNLSFMSIAADAASVRPKVRHCFYIVVSGDKHYFQATNDNEKATWIEKLLDTSRITVPMRQSMMTKEGAEGGGFKVEVIGGVVIRTPLEDKPECVDEGCISPASSPVPLDNDAIKTGYCVKQGVFRKSWKRRYFVLTPSSLKYCRSVEDKVPLRTIDLSEIKDVRPSVGVHLNKENILEVVTENRVFYIQTCSSSERSAWISEIQRCLQRISTPKVPSSTV